MSNFPPFSICIPPERVLEGKEVRRNEFGVTIEDDKSLSSSFDANMGRRIFGHAVVGF